MNERLQSILVGLTLGDAYLTSFVGASKRSRADIKGSNKYLPYLCWLHKELMPLGASALKPKKGYEQHRFYTKAREDIGELRVLFYPKGRKVVPKRIVKILTPLALAVWYQDDGTLDYRNKYHYNALFATHCFSFSECVLLAKTLQTNFGLDVRVCKCRMRGVLRYRLYVVAASMPRFLRLVKPYITSCFEYKVRPLTSQQQR